MQLRAEYALLARALKRLALLALPFTLVFYPGCTEDPNAVGKPRSQIKGGSQTTPKPAFIVGKRTQEIRNANAEVNQKGATVGTTRITAKDPITLPGNAYVAIIGQTSILSIQHALDLYRAEHDRYPKDYDEFMSEIIKANNIALPQLPEYQKYGYNATEHKLVILEYEDIKNQSLGQ